ncbi:hypothetical protein [uncultured Rhodoblastus sp.]|uniref:hypothetical protein n=1 Tax=uncultured Rhodoblastus sp. TaxID=543037 RepID=UPI0025F0491A|nr:hypothetical protein [uncultured Rhodoblastus sp.]
MSSDFNSGGAQLIRFPVELVARPTTDLLRSLAPDFRHVSLVAEAFGLDEPPLEVRHEADRAMAERIAMTTYWPEDANAKRAALEKMLKPLVERAIRLCREAREAGKRSDEAAEKFVTAQLAGGYWLKPLEDASDARAFEWASSLIDAYAASEEALGAARAVRMAIRGEAWRPFDLNEEVEVALLGAASR